MATLGILKEKGIKSLLLIIQIRINAGNEFTKFDIVIKWKLDCLMKKLFPFRIMKKVLYIYGLN